MKRYLNLLLGLTLCVSAALAQDYSKVEIKSTDLGHGVYMLTGRGGNIGVATGADATFIIDDQFAPLSDKIKAAIAQLSDQPVKFVINTHWHGDHTGGNEHFGTDGAVIVAQENVRNRMSKKAFIAFAKREVPPAPAVALPVITFIDRIALHLNGDDIDVIHVPHAHTDGDSQVKFEQANVLHMGDTLFNHMYPFIDLSSGGSIDGYIAALENGLALSDDKTRVIPGHGPLANRQDIAHSLAMLRSIRGAVAGLIEAGKTRDEVLAAKPSKAFDADFATGFIKPDVLVGFVYDSLKNPPKE